MQSCLKRMDESIYLLLGLLLTSLLNHRHPFPLAAVDLPLK